MGNKDGLNVCPPECCPPEITPNDLDVISKLLDSKLVTFKETLANDIAESVAANVQRSLSSFNWDSF